MRIIQISDTHLSCEHAHFDDNTERLAAVLQTLSPDLIVHTGDVSMDGAVQERDLELAERWSRRLPAEVLSIPGNHDVGDLVSNRPDQPVTEERLSAWRQVFGPDYWFRDVGGWRLIGLNAMLLGTELAEEDRQSDWLASALETEFPIAVFLHKPLCIDDMNEGPCGYWTVAPGPRARVAGLLAGRPVKLIASGHLHIQRQALIDGVSHVWCPAASFVVGDSQQDLGGERRLGYVEHTFHADTVMSRFIRPDGLQELLLDTVRDEIYPKL